MNIFEKEKLLHSVTAQRLFSGVWFAVAAAIPVGFYFLFDPLSSGRIYRLVTVVFPVLAAGIVGSSFGARILNPKKTRSASRAALYGLATAGMSFLLFYFFDVWAAVLYDDNLGSEGIFRIFYMFAIMFAVGLVLLGWLIAIVGTAAGWVLYTFQNKTVDDAIADIVK